MMKEVRASQLKAGDVLAQPFKRTATVEKVVLRGEFVYVHYVEPYEPRKFHVNDWVLLEGNDDV